MTLQVTSAAHIFPLSSRSTSPPEYWTFPSHTQHVQYWAHHLPTWSSHMPSSLVLFQSMHPSEASTTLPQCRSDHVLSLLWTVSGSHCSQVSPDPLAWVTRPFRNWLLLASPVLGLTILSLEIYYTTLVNPLQLPKMIMLLTFVQNCALCLECSTAFPLVKWSTFLIHWEQAQVSSVSWSGCSSYVFRSTLLMPLIALLTLYYNFLSTLLACKKLKDRGYISFMIGFPVPSPGHVTQ